MMCLRYMIILALSGFLAAALCVAYIIYLRRQIAGICRQMDFIEEHDSNKLVSVDLRDKAVLRLVSRVNALEQEKKRVTVQAKNNERNFKDTISGISHDIRTPLTSLCVLYAGDGTDQSDTGALRRDVFFLRRF